MSSQKNKSQRSSILRDNSLRKSITKKIKRISSKLSKMSSSSNNLQSSSKSLSSRSGSSSSDSSLESSQNRSSLLKSSDLESIYKKHESPFHSKLNISFSSQDNLGPAGSGYRIVGEYDEDDKNQKFPLDCIYGPYPDEVLLSGIDRFLHIIGMKSFVAKDFNLKELCAPRRLSLTSVSSASLGSGPNNKNKDCKCDKTKDRDFTLIDVETLINNRLKSLQDALPKCLCDEETFKDLIKTMLPNAPSKIITKATIATDAPVIKKSKHRKKDKRHHGTSETTLTIENEIVHTDTASSGHTTTTGDSHKSKSAHKKKSKSSMKNAQSPAKDVKNIDFKETVSLNVLPSEHNTSKAGRCTCSLTECRMLPNIPSPFKSKVYYSARKHSVKKMKPKIVTTQWAFTRVNVFDDASRTFEVMPSMSKPPPQVVTDQTEIIFAVLPDGSTVCYDNIQRSKRSML